MPIPTVVGIGINPDTLKSWTVSSYKTECDDPMSNGVTCLLKLWSTHVLIYFQVVIHSHVVNRFEANSISKGQFVWSNMLFWIIFDNLVIHFGKKIPIIPNGLQLERVSWLWIDYPKLINQLPQFHINQHICVSIIILKNTKRLVFMLAEIS